MNVDAIIAAILETDLTRLDIRAIRNSLPKITGGHYKTHCKWGHPRTPDNLYKNGSCRKCAIAWKRR